MLRLKNYTTNVSAERSISEIERLLADFGANAVMKNYLSDGRVISLAFKLEGKAYNLPANMEGVKSILYKKNRSTRDAGKKRDERTYRITWRILKDWVHAQLSLIASGQAQPEEVLLPFLWDGKKTLYQAYKEGRLQLTHNKKGEEEDEKEQ